MTINAGTFNGGLNTIKNDDYGKLIINNGKFINDTQHCVMNWNETQINGGVFESTTSNAVWNGYGDETMDKGSLQINEGSFTAPGNCCVIYRYSPDNGSFEINGGTFSHANICNDSRYTSSKNSDGTYSIDRVKVAQVGAESYATLEDAIKAAGNNAEVKLLQDISVAATQIINKNIILNLNGKKITSENVCPVEIQGNVKITDSGDNGAIENNSSEGYTVNLKSGSLTLEKGKIGSLTSARNGLKVSSGTSFNMKGGKILSGTYALVAIGAADSPISINIVGGEVTAIDTAIYLRGNITKSENEERDSYVINTVISDNAVVAGTGEASILPAGVYVLGKGANLTVEGGQISGTTFGILGNGSFNENQDCGGTIINITGGKVFTTDANSLGIYQPQRGNLTITGGNVEGKSTGIEVRAGDLTVTGGNIVGQGKKTTVISNGNGSTTDGVGIAIAQHTTKFPINVEISGGNISGYSAFYESNPQKNTNVQTDVQVTVSGGEFKAINGGSVSVYSEDKTEFISGGYFSHMPDESYVVKDKKIVASENSEYPYTVAMKTTEPDTLKVDTAVIEPTVDESKLPDTISSEKKNELVDSAKSLEAQGLKLEADDAISETEIKNAKDEALKDESPLKNSSINTLNTFSTIFFDVAISDYKESNDDKSLTLDIQPMTQLVVSTASDPKNFVFEETK